MNSLHRDLKKIVLQTEEHSAPLHNQPWYPSFHLAPPLGWMNDPNGLCQFQGTYHAFFQYSPFDVNGGLKFWGHSTSKDLLHWSYQGTALYPDQTYDCHGVYSGSALASLEGIEVFYTGNVKESGNFDYIHTGRQANVGYAASRDGIHFDQKKCLMTNKDFPTDCTCHVRDPKVWKEKNCYYMVLGSRTKDNQGEILLYRSEDKEHWELLNRITTPSAMGYMWECPDLFSLDGQTVLSVSPQGMGPESFRFQNTYQSGYFYVTGNYKANYKLSAFEEWDYGFDFYAPQTFLDDSGRRILIGWMGMPDTPEFTNPTVLYGWQHCMTVPRELSVKNGKLLQTPVRELASLEKNKCSVSPGMEMKAADAWKLELANREQGDFRIILSNDLILTFQRAEQMFTMEFTKKAGGGRTLRRMQTVSCDSLLILMDHSCLECFINGGERVMSTRFYPKGIQTIRIEGNASALYCELA